MERMQKRTVRKEVPETDPAYLEAREQSRNSYSKRVFGRDAARSFDYCKEDIAHSEFAIARLEASLAIEKDSDRAKDIFDQITDEKEKLFRLEAGKADSLHNDLEKLSRDLVRFLILADEDEKSYVIDEVRHMLEAPELQAELHERLGDVADQLLSGELNEDVALEFAKRCIRREFTADFLYNAAMRHSERVAEQEAQLAEIVHATKQEFGEAVRAAVSRGFFPEHVLRSLERIDGIPVQLTDKLDSILSSTLGESHDSGKVTVSNIQLQPEKIARLKRTLFHEFLHEISGKSVTVKTVEDPRWKKPDHYARNKKSGVALHGERANYSPNRWLNEAITEWLTLELSGYDADDGGSAYKGSSAYPDERQELDRLFDKGLQKEMVVSAYFENITSDQKDGRGEHFAKLVQEVNRVEGRFGFARLENEHLMREVENWLSYSEVYPADQGVPVQADYPVKRLLTVHVDIGTRDEVKVVKDYVYAVREYPPEYKGLSEESQMEKLNSRLRGVRFKFYGKVDYAISEREKDAEN